MDLLSQILDGEKPHDPMLGHNNPPSDDELLAEAIKERNDEALKRANDLVSAVSRIPDELDDEWAEKVTTLVKQMTTCFNKLETARKTEYAPFDAKVKFVNTLFKGYTVSLDTAKDIANKKLTVFLNEKRKAEQKRLADEAERERQRADELAKMAAKTEGENKVAADVQLDDALEAELMADKLQQASTAQTGLGAVRSSSGSTAALRTEWYGEVDDLEKLDLNSLRYLFKADELNAAIKRFVAGGGRELSGARIWSESKSVVR